MSVRLSAPCETSESSFFRYVLVANELLLTMRSIIKGYLNGMFFISMLFFTALFGGIFIMGPAFVLLLISERWFRWYNDFAVRLWLILPGVCAYISLNKLLLLSSSLFQ